MSYLVSRLVRIAKAVKAEVASIRRLVLKLANMPRPLLGLALLAAIFAIAWMRFGPGSGAAVQTPQPATEQRPVAPQQSGYLGESSNFGSDRSWVIFIDLTSGTIYEAQRLGDQVATASGTVMRKGSTLVINVTQSGGGVASGTLAVHDKGGGLEVSVPMSDGTVRAYDFSSKQVSDYNAEVQKMQARIISDQRAAARASKSESASAAAQQRQQLAEIEATEQLGCAAIAGQFHGDTGGTGSLIDNWCSADPNRKWHSGSGLFAQSGSCAGDFLYFNFSDGTVNEGELQDERQIHPGCFD